MAFDFPSAPSVGQEFTSGVVAYVFNGTGWAVKPAQSNISAGDIVFPPSGNIAGDSALEAIQELDAEKVAKVGDTMSGLLTLAGDATADLHAVPKRQLTTYAAPLDALAYSGMQVNGGFEVSQERANVETFTPGYICDGWAFYQTGTMAVTCGRLGTSSGVNGLSNTLYGYVAVAQPSLGAGDQVMFYHYIEGYRATRLAWGTANAQPLTIAFWTSHARTGVYSVSLRNSPITHSYVATYTQVASAVPQYNVITIPGCTIGTWTSGNVISIVLSFMMACGSSGIASSANTWLSGNLVAAPGQVNGVAAITDVFRIMGVVVLPGTQAPTAAQSPLIMRPYDQELLTCQRYFQPVSFNGPMMATDPTVISFNNSYNMRATPTVTAKAQLGVFCNGADRVQSANHCTIVNAGPSFGLLQCGNFTGLSIGASAARTGNVTFTVAVLDARL